MKDHLKKVQEERGYYLYRTWGRQEGGATKDKSREIERLNEGKGRLLGSSETVNPGKS